MRISVVIATYGGPTWSTLAASRALPSAVDQGAYEIVVEHQANGTLATARNAGAEAARGDWLVFLDADDELDAGFIAAMKAAWSEPSVFGLMHPDLLLFTPAVQYVRGKQRPKPKIWPEVPIEDGNWLIIATAVPRTLFQEVGGFQEWPLYEDWCLWQRCLKVGARVVKVPEAVYIAHANAHSRNRKPGPYERRRWHDAIRRANFPELYEQEVEA